MAFAVIGVIGPGLLKLKPPQWLGSDAPEQSVEVLSPPAEVGGEVALPEEPRQAALADCWAFCCTIRRPRACSWEMLVVHFLVQS